MHVTLCRKLRRGNRVDMNGDWQAYARTQGRKQEKRHWNVVMPSSVQLCQSCYDYYIQHIVQCHTSNVYIGTRSNFTRTYYIFGTCKQGEVFLSRILARILGSWWEWFLSRFGNAFRLLLLSPYARDELRKYVVVWAWIKTLFSSVMHLLYSWVHAL